MKTLGNARRPLCRAALGAAACALALTGCGGGGSGAAAAPGSAATDSVPAAASSSVAALVGWASALAQSDVAQPLATSTFRPPQSDTTEPTPIML